MEVVSLSVTIECKQTSIFTDLVRSTREGNIFSHVCLSVHIRPYPMMHQDRQERAPAPKVGRRPPTRSTSQEGLVRKKALWLRLARESTLPPSPFSQGWIGYPGLPPSDRRNRNGGMVVMPWNVNRKVVFLQMKMSALVNVFYFLQK